MASNIFVTTKQAQRDHAGAGRGASIAAPLARLSQIALGYFTHRWNRLDIEETPNSVKRDLGFLDGRAPYREEERMH
ncbi:MULTISPECIES: hypothetical protein [Rhizobium]|uniref:hypothetical protein n=1 Tax=Rhizobium TaxID=379 RepID=UPI000828E6F1|nr:MULTISPECIES: hypothetical protein [Rhizobium]NTF40365.1 hypothetical protein [Rhizobium rhizogenes]OCJ03359.1 hypothetical protein A6U86_31345 [Rhizobium sp. AC27/96]TIX91644.1 hypothetical protein BSK43_012030 [Rhizobium sp. P44RR-XXIV]